MAGVETAPKAGYGGVEGEGGWKDSSVKVDSSMSGDGGSGDMSRSG
jgi:hypothetical protein